MGKYERRIFLDRLVELREGYQQATHEATSMGVSGAISYGIALLDDSAALDAILGEDLADPASISDASA